VLVDGRRLEGLILSDEASLIDGGPLAFIEIVQPPGRPTYLIGWPEIPGDRLASWQRLPEGPHAELASRVQRIRTRRDTLARAELAVRLSRSGEDGPWEYRGPWFELTSTADPSLTRKAIVRLERLLATFERLLPADPHDAADGAGDLRVELCGTPADERRRTTALGIEPDHPAFYVPDQRLLFAGCEVPTVMRHFRTAEEALDLAEAAYVARHESIDTRLEGMAGQLAEQGVPSAKRAEAVRRARLRDDLEHERAMQRIKAARRRNRRLLEDAEQRFHRWLAHEAWHAHAERLAEGDGLPLWLDEGLAQVMEHAQMEVGSLRLDAADPQRLASLQADLSADPLAIAAVITADSGDFLVGHGEDGEGGSGPAGHEASRRKYLYAWGLALDLALISPVLSRERLLAARADADDPLEAFERLVGESIEAFEPRWRRRILGLSRRGDVAIPPREPAEPPAAAAER